MNFICFVTKCTHFCWLYTREIRSWKRSKEDQQKCPQEVICFCWQWLVITSSYELYDFFLLVRATAALSGRWLRVLGWGFISPTDTDICSCLNYLPILWSLRTWNSNSLPIIFRPPKQWEFRVQGGFSLSSSQTSPEIENVPSCFPLASRKGFSTQLPILWGAETLRFALFPFWKAGVYLVPWPLSWLWFPHFAVRFQDPWLITGQKKERRGEGRGEGRGIFTCHYIPSCIWILCYTLYINIFK